MAATAAYDGPFGSPDEGGLGDGEVGNDGRVGDGGQVEDGLARFAGGLQATMGYVGEATGDGVGKAARSEENDGGDTT